MANDISGGLTGISQQERIRRIKDAADATQQETEQRRVEGQAEVEKTEQRRREVAEAQQQQDEGRGTQVDTSA